MKKLDVIWPLLIVLLIPSAIYAGPLRLIVTGGGGSDVTGMEFSFTSNAFGGGAFDFTNASGEHWTSLTIVAPRPTFSDGTFIDVEDLFLETDLFTSAVATADDVSMTMLFYGLDSSLEGLRNGIPDGSHFWVGLTDGESPLNPEGQGEWLIWEDGVSHPIELTATAGVPDEPENALLLLLGGIFIAGVYLTWGKRQDKVIE